MTIYSFSMLNTLINHSRVYMIVSRKNHLKSQRTMAMIWCIRSLTQIKKVGSGNKVSKIVVCGEMINHRNKLSVQARKKGRVVWIQKYKICLSLADKWWLLDKQIKNESFWIRTCHKKWRIIMERTLN
jgi:hypothetical protein